MTQQTRLDKQALRERATRIRAALGPEARTAKSRWACASLMATPSWDRAERVALFHSMPDEISTQLLLESAWRTGRRVALPFTPPLGEALRFRWVDPGTELERSRFGVLEPGAHAASAPLTELDLVVVPGLAFDQSGARLGYGGGYYDRTLSGLGVPTVMLAFDCQRAERVPMEPHDVRVRAIATEVGLVTPKREQP